ncbi:hypothetical protein BDV10DRAFT_165927 [Aspergillus recurvatus]
MPRPSIDLEPYRQEICDLYQTGTFVDNCYTAGQQIVYQKGYPSYAQDASKDGVSVSRIARQAMIQLFMAVSKS